MQVTLQTKYLFCQKDGLWLIKTIITAICLKDYNQFSKTCQTAWCNYNIMVQMCLWRDW